MSGCAVVWVHRQLWAVIRRGLKAGSWRLRGPFEGDHKLSQLAAERLLLNSDSAGCTSSLQRDLILFIKPIVVYSLLSTVYNYTCIRAGARLQMVQLQFYFKNLTFRKRLSQTFCRTKEVVQLEVKIQTPLWTFHLCALSAPKLFKYWQGVHCRVQFHTGCGSFLSRLCKNIYSKAVSPNYI